MTPKQKTEERHRVVIGIEKIVDQPGKAPRDQFFEVEVTTGLAGSNPVGIVAEEISRWLHGYPVKLDRRISLKGTLR